MEAKSHVWNHQPDRTYFSIGNISYIICNSKNSGWWVVIDVDEMSLVRNVTDN